MQKELSILEFSDGVPSVNHISSWHMCTPRRPVKKQVFITTHENSTKTLTRQISKLITVAGVLGAGVLGAGVLGAGTVQINNNPTFYYDSRSRITVHVYATTQTQRLQGFPLTATA
jgi:hypothetical protein